jgi:glucose-1-phosphate cytidylyltransferase
MQNVPVFILAGGLGTRISEETHLKPKPMVEIGGIPILIHIMRRYYSFGFNDFVICAGYRSWEIKQYFLNYEFRQSDLMIDHRNQTSTHGTVLLKSGSEEKWRVRVIDTGEECLTGARVARAFDQVQSESFEHFAVTYGDGLSDVDLVKEFQFHSLHDKLGTILGVHPMARFGELDVDGSGHVKSFLEKPQSRQGMINGGFFFFRKGFRNRLVTDSDCTLEGSPLSKLAEDDQLMVFKHEGFWQPMDTLRDKNQLDELWQSGKAPWLRAQ